MSNSLLTAQQVAELLNVKAKTVYAAAEAGRIPCVRLWQGKRRSLLRFSREAIENAGDGFLHPRQVLRELEKAMPENVMVSTDIGNINSVANSYLRFGAATFAPMMVGNA